MNRPHVMTAASLDAALLAIGTAPEGELILLSPPGAGASLGPGWWLALVAAARIGSGRDFTDWLDCADASGRALEALRLGQRRLILAAGAPGRASVAARARVLGAVLAEHAPCPAPADGR